MITEITRRDIYELFRDGIDTFDWPNSKQTYHYYGRLEEIEFLELVVYFEKSFTVLFTRDRKFFSEN